MAPVDLLLALPWLAPYAGLAWMRERRPNLSDLPPRSGEPVSIIIPARNEAATIETVLRSILASTYEPFDLIVVDDRSSDNTAAIVAGIASTDSRVRLVSGDRLPTGWFGKPWACHQGYLASSAGVLLFTDADTCHQPELLGRAVGALRQEDAALVTISPHQRCVTFWERLVMPQIWLLLGLRYHPSRVNRATRERDVIANGQFILVTREAYQAAGGHEGVRHEVAEDLALAQAFLRARRKIYFAFAERLMETRMYHSLPHLVEGWSKNVYLGGRRSFPREPVLRALVPVMLIGALLFWVVPPTVLLMSGGVGSLALPATLATLFSLVFWGLICYGMQIPVGYAPGYPLGALMTLYIVVRSIWRGERRVDWRGRVYRARPPH